MTRTERQKLAIKKWIECKGNGILEIATGVGKTRIALMLIKEFVNKNNEFKVVIGVPTSVLQKQWIEQLVEWKLINNCIVEISNTLIKHRYEADLLILDELHTFCSKENLNAFRVVKYRYFLGLTATFERLDGRHNKLLNITQICDKITIEDALANNWLSNFRNYKVLIDVDLTDYQHNCKLFNHYFAKFNFNFNIAMNCATKQEYATLYAKKLNITYGEVRNWGYQWNKLMRLRKSFVSSHPRKIEIANNILNARSDKKCITFSATIQNAESFKDKGFVLHSKKKKKENEQTINTFNELTKGVLNTSKSCDAGLDIKGLSVGIIISGDSSKIRATQRLGRTVRYEENKIAEMFTLIIKNTIDETWFNNANANQKYITINETQLEQILNGIDISIRPKICEQDLENRF